MRRGAGAGAEREEQQLRAAGDQLAALQSSFKKELVRNVKQFHADVNAFRSDWETNGPTVPGITPMQGHERLQRFKRTYDDKKRRWDEYQAGESLFGLPITDYPELTKTKTEIDLLETTMCTRQMTEHLRRTLGAVWNDTCLISSLQLTPRLPSSWRPMVYTLPYAARRSGLRALRAQASRAPCAQANEPRLRPRQTSTRTCAVSARSGARSCSTRSSSSS